MSESLFLTNKLLKYDFHMLSTERLLYCRQFVNNKWINVVVDKKWKERIQVKEWS
jgi:hypothetical protein